MVEVRNRATPQQSEFERQPLSAVVVILFNLQGEVFLKKKKNPNEKGIRETAMISGFGPLAENPNDPDGAAVAEVVHSIGDVDLRLWRGFVDPETNVGVYIGVMDDPKAALNKGQGKSVGREWVEIQAAVNTDMAFGQQNYIRQAIDLMSRV